MKPTNRPRAELHRGRSPIVAAALALAFAGCSSTPRGNQPVAGGPLPGWDGMERALFDDAIDLAAVGLDLDARSPSEDPLLRPRTESADLVGRVAVSTLTIDRAGAKVTYTMNLRVLPPPLAPPHTDDQAFELGIGPSAPAFSVLKTLGNDVRTKVFVAFLKRFHGADGPEVHFHLTADTPDVLAAVQDAAALDAVRGRDGS